MEKLNFFFTYQGCHFQKLFWGGGGGGRGLIISESYSYTYRKKFFPFKSVKIVGSRVSEQTDTQKCSKMLSSIITSNYHGITVNEFY